MQCDFQCDSQCQPREKNIPTKCNVHKMKKYYAGKQIKTNNVNIAP